jgi:uncharacterized protein YbaP (TraB family)
MKIIAALLALLLAACAPAPTGIAAAPVAKPALWKLADEDTTIWLFGTIHVLPPGYRWRDATLDKAFAGSDALVLETVLDRADPAKMSGLLLGLGTKPGLPPLADRVSPQRRATLESIIQRSKLPRPFLDGLETWTAALMLVGVTLDDLGLNGSPGVEPQLEDMFRAAKKPVEGLETPEQQLGYFDKLPEEAQREFLETLLDDPDKARVEFDKMLAAWSRGDEAAIAATFDDDLQISPHLREVLLRARNAAWADWLAKRLDKPGTVLVAVGAGHLAGGLSVQTMLAAKGLKVERVQ